MRPILVLLTILILSATRSFAQAPLPDVVLQRINDDTVGIARIDLKSLDLASAGPALRDWADPLRHEWERVRSLEKVLQNLKELQVNDVYLLLGTTDLPLDGLLIVPTTANERVLESLKSVWAGDVETTAGGVIAGSESARQRSRSAKPVARAEFGAAFQSAQGTTAQVAIAPNKDARRVIREFLPVLPPELGGGISASIVDGTRWLALGINLPPKVEIRLIVQSTNAEATQALHKAITATLATAARSDTFKSRFPKIDQIQGLLTPTLEGDRLVLAINDANGGTKKLIDDVGTPLLTLARENARRTRTVTNLKHLGLAMHNYYEVHKSFPPSGTVSKDGKQRLLSWRVMILPYLDQEALYKQFHLDEPWDSEHNKGLIAKLPEIYDSAIWNAEMRQKGMTTYQVPVGPKTVFGMLEGAKFRDIIDGTSNTVMIVDVLPERAVVWTKPDDLPFDPKDPWRGVAVLPKGTFWACFCDGSVRRFDNSTTAINLRRYFEMNDGEVIDQ